MPSAPRVLISIEPSMYAEALAFSIGRHRPHAEVSVLGPSEGLEDAVLGARPHLVVANRVPRTVRERAFWVKLDEPRAGEKIERLGAEISAEGYSKRVDDLRTAHVVAALDRAEEELVLEGRGIPRGAVASP
jgi:hypothetical protein